MNNYGRYRIETEGGIEGINLALLAYWRLWTGQTPGNDRLYLYFSGVEEPIHFFGDDATAMMEILRRSFRETRRQEVTQ